MTNVAQVLTRFVVGVVFAGSGWGKLQNLAGVTEFFASLGIPAPHIQASFVAGVELICGLLILLGFTTRLASLPLVITMIVAIMTAKMSDIETYHDLLGLSEFLYIILLVWLIATGGGYFSIDHFLKKKAGLDKLTRFL